MSVPAPKRKPGRLVTERLAFNFASYTLTIAKKETNFPKHGELIKKIQRLSIEILSLISDANEHPLETLDDYKVRREMQVLAIAKAKTMLMLMTLADEVYGVEEGRCEYWTGLASDLKTKLINWRSSEKRRYPQYAALVDDLEPSSDGHPLLTEGDEDDGL